MIVKYFNHKVLPYKNLCSDNVCVFYGYSENHDTFQVTSLFDLLVGGSAYDSTGVLTYRNFECFTEPYVLLLYEKTLDFIESEQPGWKPSSTFTVDKCFDLSVNFSVDGFCNLLKSQESK